MKKRRQGQARPLLLLLPGDYSRRPQRGQTGADGGRTTNAARRAPDGIDVCSNLPACEEISVARGSRRRDPVSAGADLVGQDDGLGDVLHGFAIVHAHLLDLPECFGFGQALLVHQDAFGPIHQLAGFKRHL